MKNLLLPLFLVFLLFSFFNQEADAATRRYRLVWNDNPATTMGFALDQYDDGSGSLSNPVIYYGTSPNSMTIMLAHDRYEPESGMDNYFFKAINLQPNTIYYFQIQDGQTTSQTFYFETAPDDPNERISIIAGGDSRAAFDGGDQQARQNANKLVAKLRPHCVLFGGDYTNLDTNGEWQTWMDDWQLTIASDGRMTPIIATRGNHELLDGSRIYDLFNTASGSSNPDDTYYALNLGGDLLRVYTLNSMISVTGDQATWLANDLAANCTNWKIAQYHYPMRPHSSGKDEQDDQRSAWCPAFEAHGVQLALESDSHLCKYTQPVSMSTEAGSAEGYIQDNQHGVVYIGEGGWGATLRNADDAKPWTLADSGNNPFNQIKLLFIDKNNIEVRTIVTKNGDANYPDNINELPLPSRFNLPVNLAIWQPAANSPASGILAYANGIMTLSNPTPTNLSINLGADVPISTGMITLDAGSGFETYNWNTDETTQTINVDASIPATYAVIGTNNGCSVQDVFSIYGGAANTGKTYDVRGDNLYLSMDTCDDCLFLSSPDPRFRVRVNDNVNTSWVNWNRDGDNTNCGWLGYSNNTWNQNVPATENTTLTIQLDAWEDDDFTCDDLFASGGPNDGECGGYSTVGTHVLCDLPPCDWHTFEQFRTCESDGEEITWGVEYSYRYTFNALDPGEILDISGTFCGSLDPGLINSAIDATQWAAYQWEFSNDGTNWTNVSGNGTLATYDPSAISTTTYFRRKVNDCSGREEYSNIVVFTSGVASTPYNDVLDASVLSICPGEDATITVTGGTDGTNATTYWYDDALLTSQVGTGTTFTTPILSQTTTYYVVRQDDCGISGAYTVSIEVLPDYIIITDPGVNGLYQAGIQITTNGTIGVNTNADFKAGTVICIEPGFAVPTGAEFSGTIEDCQ